MFNTAPHGIGPHVVFLSQVFVCCAPYSVLCSVVARVRCHACGTGNMACAVHTCDLRARHDTHTALTPRDAHAEPRAGGGADLGWCLSVVSSSQTSYLVPLCCSSLRLCGTCSLLPLARPTLACLPPARGPSGHSHAAISRQTRSCDPPLAPPRPDHPHNHRRAAQACLSAQLLMSHEEPSTKSACCWSISCTGHRHRPPPLAAPVQSRRPWRRQPEARCHRRCRPQGT